MHHGVRFVVVALCVLQSLSAMECGTVFLTALMEGSLALCQPCAQSCCSFYGCGCGCSLLFCWGCYNECCNPADADYDVPLDARHPRWCAACKNPDYAAQGLRLACGHTFDFLCWRRLGTQKSCPLCYQYALKDR